MGHLRFTGITWERTSSLAPCSDTARRNGLPKAARRRSPGTLPEVEMVIWRAPMFSPWGSRMMVSAASRLSMLARGSPIPMNTRLSTRSPAISSAARICPRISEAVRLRVNPSSPLAQNRQPKAHPTCEETHSVMRELCAPPCPTAAGMMTDSTRWPSCMRERNLRVVPVALSFTSTTCSGRRQKRPASSARNAGGRLLICSKEEARCFQIHSCSWVARNGLCPMEPSSSTSASRVYSSRQSMAIYSRVSTYSFTLKGIRSSFPSPTPRNTGEICSSS